MSRIPMFVFLFDFKYSQGQKQQSTWLNLPGGSGNSCGGGWQPSVPGKGCQAHGQLRNLCTDLSQWKVTRVRPGHGKEGTRDQSD